MTSGVDKIILSISYNFMLACIRYLYYCIYAIYIVFIYAIDIVVYMLFESNLFYINILVKEQLCRLLKLVGALGGEIMASSVF